ncbi:MAG: folate-binding protein [Solirubrobacteraceae bacterium]|nr:folate-binding protein [Solirubrobacteraceae bacterium]
MSDEPRRPTAVPEPPAADDVVEAAATLDGYRRATTDAGVVDRSASGKLALTGADAAEFLAGQVTADTVALGPGEGAYAALLTPKGKIVTDLRVLAAGDELLILCERSGLQALFTHLRRHLIGFDVELHKRTLERGLLSIVGPRAGTVAAAVAGGVAPGSGEHDHVAATVEGRPVRLVRTDVGVDVLCDAADTDDVAAALERSGARPIPEATAEILRVEHGRPRLHHDMDDATMPAEAGIVERAVSFTKGCYIGQETVARLHWRGRPNRHLRGLRLERPVDVGTVLVDDGREVGRVTSVVTSPRHGPIALALVRREVEPGATVSARPVGEQPVAAAVTALPFAASGGRAPA